MSEKMEVDTPATEEKKAEHVTPSASGESAAEHPDMKLAQAIHKAVLMSSNKIPMDTAHIDTLKADLIKMSNPSLIESLASPLQWDLATVDIAGMKAANETTLNELEEKVKEAKENAGDMEVLEGRIAVAQFAAKSMSKKEALAMYQLVLDLPKLSSGKQMDALMEQSRVCSFYSDTLKNKDYIAKISKLAEESGDWDRRNRLKVYTALQNILTRDMKTAASLLIDCIATFSCTELCSYPDFILYTMMTNILYLPRTDLKAKIIDGSEILSVKDDVMPVFTLVKCLYDCDYKGYLQAMVEVESVLLADRFLFPHAGYIMRELHVLGYKQFLDSYKSVTLVSMAQSFGVSVDFLDVQLSRFIAAGRLTAKIDKFGGVVETNRPDLKNAQYRDMIQQGDLLLNRIQKLARVVDV